MFKLQILKNLLFVSTSPVFLTETLISVIVPQICAFFSSSKISPLMSCSRYSAKPFAALKIHLRLTVIRLYAYR